MTPRKLAGCAVVSLVALALLASIVLLVPRLNNAVSRRLEAALVEVQRFFNPPEQAVFIPQGADATVISAVVAATLTQAAASPTPTLTPAPTRPAETPAPTSTPPPSPTPTLPPTPIPGKALLAGIRHEYQKMNNCGPANLAMALSFWGWQGDQIATRSWLRPAADAVDDKNVSPWELAAFVESETTLRAALRFAGDLDTLKRLVAAGFPVIIEKGFEPPKEDWMGHYLVLNGYDDERARFTAQDSYIMPDFPLPYDQMGRWLDFNYVYIVLYPPEQEAAVMDVLGAQADPQANLRYAAERAAAEAAAATGRDRFFALYNLGSARVELQDYGGAAAAYDEAYAVYAALPAEQRPWRMLWYQPGPYAAYYHTGRYQDVVSLANTTLAVLDKPILEEALYWRGMARLALGSPGGVDDLAAAYAINPRSTAAGQALTDLGQPLP